MLWVIDLSESPGRAEQRVAAMDLGWAQELLGKQGRLTSLQLRLKDPRRSEEVAAKVNAMLPADLHAEAPRQRSLQLQNMVSAFRLNLTALSMVSLLVGVFLVYNTISASVARRRREIGILRAVGASRNEVRALFLGEACLFGIVGRGAGARERRGAFLGAERRRRADDLRAVRAGQRADAASLPAAPTRDGGELWHGGGAGRRMAAGE